MTRDQAKHRIPVISIPSCCLLTQEQTVAINEQSVHPGMDTPELLALEPDGNHFRQTDDEFWTSRLVKEIIQQEEIILIDYRFLQETWRKRL